MDYTSVSQDFIFDISDTQMCSDIMITNDVVSESCESFNIMLDSSNERAVIQEPSMTVLIYDDDGK